MYNRPIKGVKKELEVEFHAERYEATPGTLYDYDSFWAWVFGIEKNYYMQFGTGFFYSKRYCKNDTS